METLSRFPANSWPLQDAKARFSELVNRALSAGTQIVTRHGKPVVAVVSIAEYARLTTRAMSLGAFLASAPRAVLDVDRSRDGDRSIEV
jgi:prevent-host-death family protein